jgi:molybdopterin molybdotransferase
MALLPVAEALSRILTGARLAGTEDVLLANAMGRVLASPLKARRDQPPFDASAMDGYAVIAGDGPELDVIGMSAAGHRFRGTVKRGKAVRIFTGAPVPAGADAVIIQENVTVSSTRITCREPAKPGQNIRRKGLDFARGEALIAAGTVINARDLGLAAAMNCATVRVRKKPLVAVFATGDELVEPGGSPNQDQIISSNSTALAALAAHFGASVTNLGIVRDDLKATIRAIRKAAAADILLTTGGASVGDHDHVQEALKAAGVKVDFWKVALRPGKPLMYGRKDHQHVLGLPGNPVSAQVCARLFLVPLLRVMSGLEPTVPETTAILGANMKANDNRQDYVRARLETRADGTRIATPFGKQDSSMQRTFREAACLIIRPPLAPEAAAGTSVPVVLLDF